MLGGRCLLCMYSRSQTKKFIDCFRQREPLHSDKREKKRRKKDDKEEEDRISRLPDDVLLHILSLLPDKETIATSLLSKRWQFLWRVVPSLNSECLEATSHEKVNNSKFLSRRQSLTTPRISSFRLKITIDHHMRYFAKWLAAETNAGKVERLDLNLWPCQTLYAGSLLQNVFSCSTVVSLKLKAPYVPFVSVTNLTSLNHLHLDTASCSDRILKNFLYKRPALEVFHLKQRSVVNELKIVRGAQRIKLLERRGEEFQLVIQSESDFVSHYLEGSLENVVKAKAYMTLSGPELIPTSTDAERCFGAYALKNHVLSALEKLRNVEFLSFADLRINGWPSVLDLKRFWFQNLVQLRLYLRDANSGFKDLPAKCPKLLRDSSSEPIIMDDSYDISKICSYHNISIVPI